MPTSQNLIGGDVNPDGVHKRLLPQTFKLFEQG